MSAADAAVSPRVCDMHTHVCPESFPDWGGMGPGLSRSSGATMLTMSGTNMLPVDERFWYADRRLEDMDAAVVHRQVVSVIPALTGYQLPTDLNARVARFLNEYVATFASHPSHRFVAMGTVPLQDLTSALAELRYLREQLGIGSVLIGTAPNGLELDDDVIVEFLSACAALDVAVFVHPMEPVVGRQRMNDFYLPNVVGNVLETTLAMSRLIFSGVLASMPNLKICFAHGGGAMSYVLGRLDRGYEIRPEIRSRSEFAPSAAVRQIYVDSLTFDTGAVELAIAKHGRDRVLFGTDYPFALGAVAPYGAAHLASLPRSDVEHILARNVSEFLAL